MNINQKYIDLHLLCCSGYGNVDYAYDDCKIIQRAIQDKLGVTLSIAECYNFWHWRSEQYDASFLNVGDSLEDVQDIAKWFIGWLEETDYTHSCELFEEAKQPVVVEKTLQERAKELTEYAKSLTPEQLREATEKFKSLMPHRAINYSEIAKKMFPIQPMPEGATPYYLDHTFGEQVTCGKCWYRDESGPDNARVSRCDHPDIDVKKDLVLTDLGTSPEWCPKGKQ